MSDNGGSDLDVFKTLNKAPPSARKQTLVGLAVPPPPPPPSATNHALASRTSAEPPEPPRVSTDIGLPRVTPLPPDPPLDLRGPSAIDDVEELHDVEELPSAENNERPDANFGEGDNTEVFQLNAPETDALRTPGNFYDRPSAPGIFNQEAFAALSSSVGLPPPPPSPSSVNLPPPPPSSVSLPPPPPPSTTALSNGQPSRPSGAPRPPAPSYTTLTRPPPPPPSAPVRSTPGGGEWDDEDDKTTIYTRDSQLPPFLLGTAPARTRSIPDAPPPPMSRPSAPIPIQTSATPTLQAQRVNIIDAPASVPPGPAANRTPILAGGAAVALLGLVLFFLLRATTGGLVVTVAGPGNKPLDVVEVLLDGKVICTSSPCSQKDVPAGTHMVQARADGYQGTAEAAVLVTGNQDAVHNIRLVQAAGSGVRISALGSGLRLSIDGREIGPLPQELSDMTPGPHVFHVESEQFDAWEQTLTVVQDEMQVLGPLKLRVKKGLAKVVAGSNADGAKVVLERAGDRRSLSSLPMTLDIETAKSGTLVATRRGYQTYRQPLVFEDGVPEKTFEVALTPEAPVAGAGPVAPRAPAPSPNPVAARPQEAAQGGTLNINSIPAASVILDGRPLGTTPKVGVAVTAGNHTVIFIKDGERQTKSVKVGAGQSQTVVHRFN